MGFFSNVVGFEKRLFGSEGVRGIVDPANTVDKVSHDILHLPTAEEVRNQKAAINSQVNLNRQRTQIALQEASRIKSERQFERQRIQAKQVRSLQRSKRPSGFLDQSSELSDKLGV